MIAVPSFAKINLYFRVLEREPGGYHLVETVLQTVSLHDTLTFESLSNARLEVESDLAPPGKANIVYRAAQRLLPAKKGLRIRIRKRIPMGSGLGGGSSNAAVTLLVLNSLFGMKYNLSELVQIGGELGADVPFFLVGGTACGQHYGESVLPLPDAPAASMVLLYPAVHISTAHAYGKLKLTKQEPNCTMQHFCYSLLRGRVDALDDLMRNDFERVIFRNQRIAAARGFLERQGLGKVHLSGSGSTLFALGNPRRKLQAKSNWQVWPARFLSRGQYRQRLSRHLNWPER